MERKFKKFGGRVIPDLGEYVKAHLNEFPGDTIYVGCDSDTRRGGKKIMYADIVAFYDNDLRGGVHYVFNRELRDGFPVKIRKTGDKVLDKKAYKKALTDSIFQKIWQEVERVKEIGLYLEEELEGLYPRKSPEELVALGYSSHQNKLIDLDIDINPDPGWSQTQINLMNAGLEAGIPHNRSNIVYESAKAYLEGQYGFRVRFKPECWAAKCAADMICKKG